MGEAVGKAKYMGIGVVEGEPGPTTICPRCESRDILPFRPSTEAALKRRETLNSACTMNHHFLVVPLLMRLLLSRSTYVSSQSTFPLLDHAVSAESPCSRNAVKHPTLLEQVC